MTSFTLCLCESVCARLAQSVEHETLNLRVVGSSPTLGGSLFFFVNSKGEKVCLNCLHFVGMVSC